MVLKAYGVVGSMSTLDFNQLLEDVGDANTSMAVMQGLVVTAVSGLTFSVSAGRSLQCGTTVFNDAAMQKTLAARSTGNRIDRLVLQVDLTKGRDTAATLEVVQGRAVATGSPVAPQLIQDVGVQHKWQTPLAQILVPPTGALTITDDRPRPAGSPTRYAVRAARALARQLIPASTWTPILFDRIDHQVNDFGGTSIALSGTNQGMFVAPVAGTYQVSAQAHFVNQAGAANQHREMRAVNRDSAGGVRWIKYGTMRSPGDNFDHVIFDGTFDMKAGQTVELQVYQDENHSVYLSDNATTPGTGSMGTGDMSYGSMTLLVAD